jgi:NAD(P)-dependent dehydrogenase (short-subunit alcohol dehydrogenase family)
VIDLGLTGKRAIVAGAGFRSERAGHGRAAALQLSAAGATVACIDIHAGRAKTIVSELEAEGGKAVAITADMTVPEEANRAVASAVEHMGGVDVCVDVIGDTRWGEAVEFSDEAWNWTFTQNLIHVFYLYRAVSAAMIASEGGGSLVAVASVDGLGSAAFHVAYGAAKAGLISLTKTFAEELGPHGIRVNAVAPGNVGGGNWNQPDVPFGSNPINPLAPPRAMDTANGILFFASELSARVTGQTLVIDGGATVRSPWGFTAESIDALNAQPAGPSSMQQV